MRGENGAAVKKSGTKKTIEDVRTVNKKINIDVDMKRTCHTYQTLIHHDFKKGEM